MKTKRATIKDVAELANVSVATVSRVLSNADYPVSAELRAQVELAAKELSFAYTTAPRQGKNSGGNREIALVVPNLANPFYVQTIQGISAVCFENGYQMILCNSQRDAAIEARMLQQLYEHKVTGVIISPNTDDFSALAGFIARGMVFVRLDQRSDNDGSYNINYDYRQGARIAVRYLLENGHQRIAFASTPLTRWSRRELFKGYTDQLSRRDIPQDEALVMLYGDDSAEDLDHYELQAGERLAAKVAQSRATAVLCVNDIFAFGMIHGLGKLGLRVPEDISVVGFDDITLARAFMPSLTTVRCPSYETGRLAAMMLIDCLQNKGNTAPLNMHLQPTLVERLSVRKLH